jgi:hypothetical protein
MTREANKLQGTGAWFNDRTGKLTASRMSAAMAYLKSGAEASERRKLKIEILCERLTGDIVPKYVTQEMQWGIDQEPVAKEYLVNQLGWEIKDIGFVPHPIIENCGCSPDGWLVDYGCLLEIKCPSSATMISWLLNASEDDNWIPPEHVAQMTLQSACFGSIPVWFVAFDPRLPDRQKLLVRKFQPTMEQIEEVETNARKFLEEVDAMFDKLTNGE